MRIGDVHGTRQAHATAHGMGMYPPDHQHGCLADGVDHMGETAEERQPGLRVVDGDELIETGTSAEGFIALAAQHDRADGGVLPAGVDGIGHGPEDVAG